MKKLFLSVLCIFLAVTLCFVILMLSGGKSIITGYSLKALNDACMIIEEDGSPIRYSYSRAMGTKSEKLSDGDRILIISDLINESYPGSTRAYIVLKLSEGKIEDTPEDTLTSLQELGWYNCEE